MTDILKLAASGDAKNVIRDMRVRSLWSPYYFVKVVLGRQQLSPDFHQPEMERFIINWADGRRKQAVQWPRGWYKTTCFTTGISIWVVCPVTDEDTDYAVHHLGISEGDWLHRMKLHDQDATQLLAFEIMDNAIKKLSIIRRQFEENQLFRTLFPEIAYSGREDPWNNKSLRIRRAGTRQMDAEGTFDAIGVDGALQSRHYTIVWEDDLVGEKARKSTVVMEDTIGWHGRLSGAFENAGEQTRFLISNIWGFADLNNYVKNNEPDFVFHTRGAIELSDDGTDVSSFPQEYPIEKILSIRDGGSMTLYDFNCQYMNRPTMPGEQEVNLKLLHYYRVDVDENGYGYVFCEQCNRRYYVSSMNRYGHYDPYNAKGAGSTSCPAIVTIGATSDEHVFLIDYYTRKDAYSGVYDHIFRHNDKWRWNLFTYEDVGHQNLTEYHIREIAKTAEYKSKHKNFPRMEGVSIGTRSNESRVREGLFPVIEKKKFGVRRTHQAFISQLETFPHKVLDHDYDLLVACAQGANKWRYPEHEDQINRVDAEEAEYLRHFNAPYSHAGEDRLRFSISDNLRKFGVG